MRERGRGERALPFSEATAIVLIAVGVLLWMFVSPGFLIVAGLGAFGPGILRELGLLRDHDEFQREAARRAGYHAYLVGGLAAVSVLSGVEWQQGPDARSEWLRLVVVVLWLTWLTSTLLTYWGPRRTAARVLIAFGSFWAVFVLASLIGEAGAPSSGTDVGQALLGIGVGALVIAPFFVLAWTAGRWPRPTGFALLAFAGAFLAIFGLRGGGLSWSTRILTDTLLIGPLLVSGAALLLLERGEREEPE